VVDVYGVNIDLNVKVVNMPGTRKTYHHGDLKRTLTAAALALVAEKGPKGFTLSEAARRAGVSVAAPYRHFADKADLLATVAEQGFVELHDALSEARTSTSDIRGQVIELGRAYVRWAVTHPDYYQVMFGGDLVKTEHPELQAAGSAAFSELLEAIIRCQEVGLLPSRDPLDIAGPMWSLVHGIASLASAGDLKQVGIEENPEDLVARAVARGLQVGELGQ
jgi:AcrR family transcriptional regulator